jgi:hypothetical protein
VRNRREKGTSDFLKETVQQNDETHGWAWSQANLDLIPAPLESSFLSLNLSFLICERGIITVPTAYIVGKTI